MTENGRKDRKGNEKKQQTKKLAEALGSALQEVKHSPQL